MTDEKEPLTADVLAGLMSQTAIDIHRDGGELAPTIAFWHEELGMQAQLMLTSKASEDIPKALFFTGLVMCSVLNPKPTWIAMNTEAWAKPAPPEVKEEGDWRMPKGHLEKLHNEGDTTVHTVLMSHVAGTKGGLTVWIVDADKDYERSDIGERHEGLIPEAFAALVDHIDEGRALLPPDYGVRQALEFLGEYITVALIPDDGGPGERLA